MLRHDDVWGAIDRLAERHGLTPSALAKRAGLDPTTFNRSKRVTAEGKLRWPSTESLAKALGAVGASPAEFVQLVAEADASQLYARLPIVPASRIGRSLDDMDDCGWSAATGTFSAEASGRPGAEELVFPGVDDPAAFVLEIDGDGHAPLYRRGDLLIVSPGAHLQPGNRVALHTREGLLHLGTLADRALERIMLEGRAPLPAEQVAWVSRILWASQ